MTDDEIKALALPAADDCVLFLWVTVPKLDAGIDVLRAWGFTYKSNFIWAKDKAAHGYWNSNKHEILLVGVKGDNSCARPTMGEFPACAGRRAQRKAGSLRADA